MEEKIFFGLAEKSLKCLAHPCLSLSRSKRFSMAPTQVQRAQKPNSKGNATTGSYTKLRL